MNRYIVFHRLFMRPILCILQYTNSSKTVGTCLQFRMVLLTIPARVNTALPRDSVSQGLNVYLHIHYLNELPKFDQLVFVITVK